MCFRSQVSGFMSRIYLDYAATTPVDSKVLEAMHPYFSENFGNPSSIHSFGQEAQRAVDSARQKIADFLGCLSQEIIFTGSATEANNLAVFGIIKIARKQFPDLKHHIITTAIEHESMLGPIKYLEKNKRVSVTYLPVDRNGVVSVEALEKALTENTVLVSIMYANNEIGTIQPVAGIAKIIKEHNLKSSVVSRQPSVVFHTDSAQAALYLPMNVSDLGVDSLALSGHKIYGPKGIGAFYLKKGTLISPLIVGASQEYGKRAGTENVPYIVGMSEAITGIAGARAKIPEMEKLRDYFIQRILKEIPRAGVNGAMANRLPNNANIRFDGVSSADLVLLLDQEGIAVSAGSACESKAQTDSHTLKALGLSSAQVRSSARFSLGKQTTKADLDHTIGVLIKLVKKLGNT